ncbi:MAG: hypothetical protein H6556_31585 [Lewinellaceae bacterium]|nr:hypothetical protein [Lewinellaceae bacterium]
MPDQLSPIRLLRVVFDTRILPREIPAFRGAVVEKVGLEHEWFHNHNNASDAKVAYHYRYPLVQYKLYRRRPVILFIGKGVDEARHFFSQPDWRVTFSRHNHTARVVDMQMFDFELGVRENMAHYRLQSWLAFNQENFSVFNQMDNLVERVQFMESALAGHILAFASGVDHHFARRFNLVLTDIFREQAAVFSGNRMLSFDVAFKADAVLPPMIGLGRAVSQGFGVLELAPGRKPV